MKMGLEYPTIPGYNFGPQRNFGLLKPFILCSSHVLFMYSFICMNANISRRAPSPILLHSYHTVRKNYLFVIVL